MQDAAGPRGEETIGTDGSQSHGACHAVTCSEGCHQWTHLSCNCRPSSAFIAGSCRVSASRTPFPFCLQVDAGRLCIHQESQKMLTTNPCNSASTSPRYFSFVPKEYLQQCRLRGVAGFRQVGFILAVAKFVVPSLPVAGVAPIPFRSHDVLLQGAHIPAAISAPLSTLRSSKHAPILLLRGNAVRFPRNRHHQPYLNARLSQCTCPYGKHGCAVVQMR